MSIEPVPLRWCTIAPMPYFDDLFVRLSTDSRVALDVIYLRWGLKDYPLSDRLGRGYPSRSLETTSGTLSQYWDALTQPNILWLVGGWGSPQYVILLSLLVLRKRKFWIFSDAPVPEGRSVAPWRRRLRKALLRHWFEAAFGIIGTGKMAVERLRLMGAAEYKLHSIPYPLDEHRFRIGLDYVQGSGEPVVIVCSGRLNIQDKRFDLALRGFAALIASQGGQMAATLRIAGSGPDERALKDLAQELGIGAHTEFLGWLGQEELAELYARGHVYLHPSDFEPYGVTVVEALYSGLYAVASQGVGAAVELVQEGVNGSLFPCGNVDRLSAALAQAVDAVQSGRVAKATVRNASLSWRMDTYVDTLMHKVVCVPRPA